MGYMPRDTTTQFVDSLLIIPRLTLTDMHRWRVFIDGRPSGRPLRSVMAPDEDSGRHKAIDFHQVEPALVRVVEIKANGTKPNHRDQLDDLWHRRPETLF
jgi:hypothetical protein